MNQDTDNPTVDDINSQSYWEQRFAVDWETNSGREQSRYFSLLALKRFPNWLKEKIESESMTICDWGCAEGDGTDVLARHLRAASITGVDFSPAAIEKARRFYPECRFVCEDYLANEGAPEYDIIFSSNTLEHFSDPWETLVKVAPRARRFLVLLLPFLEYERIVEHFYTFDFDNIPFHVEGWTMLRSEVIDASEERPSYWNGKQLFLVYARSPEIEKLGLSLADIRIEDLQLSVNMDTARKAQQADSLLAELTLLKGEADNLKIERDKIQSELSETTNTLHATQAELDSAKAQLKSAVTNWHAAVAQVQRMHSSLSWRITLPMRLSARIARHGLTPEDRKELYNRSKNAYQRIPLPQPAKRLLRKIYLATFRPPYQRAAKAAGTSFQPPAFLPGAQSPDLPDYIVWGVIDWHFRFQRPQQLAHALAAAGRRVFYVSVNMRNDRRPGFDAEPLDATGRLFQINLYAEGSPVIYTSAPGIGTIEQLRAGIGELLQWAGSRRIVSLVQHPFWYETAAVLPNSRTIYDCMDHHEGFGNTANEILALERELLEKADLTITTSAWLDETMSKHAPRRALIRNAGDFEHFAQAPATLYRDPEGRRIIGYYGAIAEWFDLDLVEAVARRFPDCCVLLVGADTVDARTALGRLPNVKFIGEVAYAELPRYLHGFDVCLLPFKVIPLTLATNPVKVYEYLSAGKPVVSVDLPEIRQFGELVHVAGDAQEFLTAVESALKEDTIATAAVSERQSFAKQQTWSHRAQDLILHAEDASNEPKASVIVVTYNNLELTRTCLASIDQYSDYAHLEIIVVDNASSDGSQAFLSEWVKGASNRKIILNDDNRGFAAANNQGLAAADGEYLVLLNNDTHVTPGWIGTLIRHMQRDQDIGLIGPVTNNIGNEAKIDIAYPDMDAMLKASSKFTRARIGRTFPLRTAAFFCVAMPRSVYARIGPLDEQFGRGFFEDDDYCRRVEEAGLRIACAQDVFIHHHLSASFNKLKSKDRLALFEENKKRYEAKWGKWVPHAYSGENSAAVPPVFRNSRYFAGRCNVCGKVSRFFFTDPALWRESLNCEHCLTTSRYRSIARGILRAVEELSGVASPSLAGLPAGRGRRRLRAYDTQAPFYYAPCAYPLPDLLKASGWIDVELSLYKPSLPLGTAIKDGVTNQNLECLTFADESLDIVITSDVMEHVRLDRQAHREIHRVLKPGGIYIFTVPHNREWEKTLTRVQIIDPDDPSRDEHLLEPEYHGDTNNDEGGGVLAYRTYGLDLDAYLKEVGFEVEYSRDDIRAQGIMNTEIYYCRKVK